MGGLVDKIARFQSESAPEQKEPESGVMGQVRRQNSEADTNSPDEGLLLTTGKKRARHGGSGPIGRARRALGYGDNLN